MHEHGISCLFANDVVPDGETITNKDKVLFVLNGIKFEIVHETRIALEPPNSLEWCGVPSLHGIDRIATKLLANADRWNDKLGLSRDLVDLCVLVQECDHWDKGYQKALAAKYANPIDTNLTKAVEAMTNETLAATLAKFDVADSQYIETGLDALRIICRS